MPNGHNMLQYHLPARIVSAMITPSVIALEASTAGQNCNFAKNTKCLRPYPVKSAVKPSNTDKASRRRIKRIILRMACFLSEIGDKYIDFFHFLRYIDSLRTMAHAFAASDAMFGLS